MAKKAVKARRRRKAVPRGLYVLSDSTGNLAQHMVAAFLTQFPPETFEVRVFPFLRSQDALAAVFERAPKDTTVVHAVVSPELKATIELYCAKRGLAVRDLTGPVVEFLASRAQVTLPASPEALHAVNASYYRRIEAVEFTLSHDDGLGVDTLREADVVLVGVSRTSKTPTCMYLAQQGIKAANISLAPGVETPKELFDLPASKIVGLLIDPSELIPIRRQRQTSFRMSDTAYARSTEVHRELAESRALFGKLGCHTIDITNQAIEETAGRIMLLLKKRPMYS